MTSDYDREHGLEDLDAGQPGWNVTLYAVWAGQLLALIGFSSRVPFLPFYLGDLGVSDVSGQTLWSGAINAAGAAAMAITAPIWGLLADRYGRKPMLLRGLFGGAGVVVMMGFANAPWQLALLQALMGVAAGGLIPSANALIAHLTPVARRGAIFGLTAAISAVGGFVGPLVGALLATGLGFRATFVASGTLLLTVAAMFLWSQGAAESSGREVEESSRRKMAT